MDSRIYILTHKRLTGQLSSIEAAELTKLSLIPENQVLSEEISYLWNISNNYFPKKDWQKDAAKQAFLDKIKTTTVPKSAPVATSTVSTGATSSPNWPKYLAAAVGLLLLAWFTWSQLNKKEVIKANDQIEYAQILDETKVWLEPGSKLTILAETDTERKVALVGEAIFDVLHNPNKPFTLDLGNDVFAEVLGTSFKAKSTHDGSNSKISVREGKVRLYSKANPEYDVTILAGQDGEIDPSIGAQRNKTIAINALMSAYDQITFKDTPLDQVFDKLGMHYGVSFKYDKLKIDQCKLSSVVQDDATLTDIIASIQDIHQGIELTALGRSTYKVEGDCTRSN